MMLAPFVEESVAGQPLVTIVALGALTLLPFVFMTTTSFVKISVVFSILRNALGTGQVPSGTIVTALSLILSLYVMAPVGSQIVDATAPAVALLPASRTRKSAPGGCSKMVDGGTRASEHARTAATGRCSGTVPSCPAAWSEW